MGKGETSPLTFPLFLCVFSSSYLVSFRGSSQFRTIPSFRLLTDHVGFLVCCPNDGLSSKIHAYATSHARGICFMSQQVLIEIEMPAALSQFKLPSGVNERLQNLLDRQDNGESLTDNERREAEGLVDIAEFLSLLRLRSNRVQSEQNDN